MNQRIVVAQATSLQVASLAQSRIVKVTKPQGDQSIVLDLRDDHSAKLDLSAVADEKMTLVQVGTKLVILFDNKSTVTADPFFDFSGKPFADLGVELGAGRAVTGEQFAQLFQISDDQSVLPDAGRIPPSGADFHDVSIDLLPGGSRPLALLGQETLAARFSGVNDGASAHSTATVSPTPIITIPPPGGLTTQVFEAGLLASRGPGESAGSHAGQPSFPTSTRAGTIGFTSPDGVQSVSLGGHTLSGTPQTFADGTRGTLTASYTFDTTTHKGAISYSYTLLDNTLGVPSASFAVAVIDKDGDTGGGNLVISIVDDAPVAHADFDALTGQSTAETGNVLTGAGTTSGPGGADISGADGVVSVVGVAAGNGAGGANPGTVGVAIAGAFGTLTLNADGSYSYVHNIGGGTDTFTYTIRDADGSLSHTTLTINLGDSAPGNIVIPPAGNPAAGTEVFEAGLGPRGSEPAGSHTGDAAFPATTSGTITFTSPDGVGKIELGGLALTVSGTPQSITDATGSLTASFTYDATTGKGTISYSYTLLDNTLGVPSASFAVAVTDVDGDRTPAGNLVISIADDAPVAVADADAVATGQIAAETGNVLTGAGTTSSGADVQGADGAVVAGVATGATGTDLANPGTVGAAIAGTFGTLTLNADGSYSYAHTGAAGGGADVFTYTIRDGDGSLSHATLTIAVANSSPGGIVIPAPGGVDTQVFEAGLAASRGPGESAGSNPAAPTTTAGTISFTSPDGVGSVSLGGHVLGAAPQTFIDATGSLTASFTYDAATGKGAINYSYTLLDNTLAVPSVSFAVAVTDKDGDTAGGNLVINIVDDAPVAVADTDVVAAGQTTAEIGNVLTGAGTTSGPASADVQGADDGVKVVSVAAGNAAVAVDPTLGATIVGAFGTLTLNADGSYSYAHTGAAGGGTDVFTYAIQDADGSQSTATLNIAVGDSSPGGIVIPAPGGAATTVFEAGLGARGGEPAGSNPAAPTTTAGTIAFTSPDGVGSVSLGGHALGSTPQTFTDATGSLTASFSYDTATGQGTINYSYTLLDNTLGIPSATFALVVTDRDGDTAGGNLVISIVDDAPVAVADTDSVAGGQVTAEVGNVLTGAGTTSGTADVQGADGGLVVVGVAAGNAGIPINGGVGAAIAGALGTLTLNVDGSYSYVHTAGGGADTFTYTIRDADGSLSTATLTIAVGNSSPGNIVIPAPGGVNTTVFEAGLLASRGPGESAGSNPAAPTTAAGTITFTSPDGVGTVTLGGHVLGGTAQTFTDATGSLTASFTYDTATGKGAISYSYTLLDNTLGIVNTTFAVAVTDRDGDSAGGNLVISIIDDAPVAVADTDSVAAGQTAVEVGNLLTGVGTTSGTADVQGADGALQVVSVAVGGTTVTVDPTTGATITGAFGTLTLSADGSYSYARDIGGPGGAHNDTFTYTVKDADGTLSTATLDIAVANSSPGDIVVPPTDIGVTAVFEAGLGARGGEPAGSNPLAPTTTDTGTISFTSLDGVLKVELGGLTLDSTTPSGSVTDATGRLTASLNYDAATGLGEISYSYTLLDNTLGIPSVSFAVAVTDLDGDRTPGDDLVITIVDDSPEALPDIDAVVAGQTTPETGNVLTGVGTLSGSSGEDVQGADGATVVSVAVGGTVVAVDPTAGATIAGALGTLTLFADGSYSYVRTAGSGTDIFTYTIEDGDGGLSSAPLVVTIGDTVPTNIVIPPPGGPDTQVFEAGLLASRGPGESAGSNPAAPTTTQTGTITFTSPDGVSKVELGGLVLTAPGIQQSFTDPTGRLTASFSYDAATGKGSDPADSPSPREARSPASCRTCRPNPGPVNARFAAHIYGAVDVDRRAPRRYGPAAAREMAYVRLSGTCWGVAKW